jgi:hypothetical protein
MKFHSQEMNRVCPEIDSHAASLTKNLTEMSCVSTEINCIGTEMNRVTLEINLNSAAITKNLTEMKLYCMEIDLIFLHCPSGVSCKQLF